MYFSMTGQLDPSKHSLKALFHGDMYKNVYSNIILSREDVPETLM